MMTADDIRNLIARRYKGDGWLVAFEVRDSTGYEKRTHGYADAIVMGTWPSRGFAVHGFEIKVSKADWQKELQNPAKAERFIQHVDHFWIVAPPKIVLESEVPENWGYMVAHKNGLRAVKDAPNRNRFTRPDMDRGFVASLLRHKPDPNGPEVMERIDTARKAAYAQGKSDVKYEHHRRVEEIERYKKADAKFEEHFGVSWYASQTWPGSDIASDKIKAAVALVERMDGFDGIDKLEGYAENMAAAVKRFKAVFNESTQKGEENE